MNSSGAALWEKGAKLIAEGARKEFDDPTMYEWFEYYYNEMKKENKKV
jgi:hypothetical protein